MPNFRRPTPADIKGLIVWMIFLGLLTLIGANIYRVFNPLHFQPQIIVVKTCVDAE